MMRKLHNTDIKKSPFGETLYDKNGILEKLPLLYPEYEKAVEVVNTMAEHAELKSKEIRYLRKRHEIDRDEFMDKVKILKRRIDRADIMRYQCFVTYIARFYYGCENDLATLMENNGYVVHSKLYIHPCIKVIHGSVLNILFD